MECRNDLVALALSVDKNRRLFLVAFALSVDKIEKVLSYAYSLLLIIERLVYLLRTLKESAHGT